MQQPSRAFEGGSELLQRDPHGTDAQGMDSPPTAMLKNLQKMLEEEQQKQSVQEMGNTPGDSAYPRVESRMGSRRSSYTTSSLRLVKDSSILVQILVLLTLVYMMSTATILLVDQYFTPTPWTQFWWGAVGVLFVLCLVGATCLWLSIKKLPSPEQEEQAELIRNKPYQAMASETASPKDISPRVDFTAEENGTVLASVLDSQLKTFCPAPEGEPADNIPHSPRINQVDYMKFICNLLIVFHHSFDACQSDKFHGTNSSLVRGFRLFIEPFMMQAVAFASGIVYTPDASPKRAQAILRLLSGYVVLQVFYMLLLKYMLLKKRPEDAAECYQMADFYNTTTDPLPWWQMLQDTIVPWWHLWYLWSLLLWRLVLPFWKEIQHPVTVAVLLGVFSGFLESSYFCIHRTMGYFPYFVLGATIKRKGYSRALLQLCSKRQVHIWANIMFILHLVGTFSTVYCFVTEEYYTSVSSYRQFPFSHDDGADSAGGPPRAYWVLMLSKLATYPIGFILTLCVLTVMPTYDSPWRSLGERTLAPYCFHMAPLMILRSYTSLVNTYSFLRVSVLGVLMAVSTAFMYIPAVHKAAHIVIMPPLSQLGILRSLPKKDH